MDSDAIAIGPRMVETSEPFPQSGLGALIAIAAAESPHQILIADDRSEATAAEFAQRIERTARNLRAAGLAPGERALVVAGAQAASIEALVALLRSGVEPALVAIGLGPVELAAHARAAGAVALVGPSHYGGVAFGETYLSVAALIDTIRIVATQGPETVDGAVDLSAEALVAATGSAVDDVTPETPVIATFQGPATAPILVLHRQAALFADALSLVEQARINPSRRIVSLLPPATIAGLVAGPFAALVGAAGLRLHGPFDARRFLAACDAAPGFHVVGPCAIGPAFDDPRLAADVASLILVSRFDDAQGFLLPPSLACERPIVDFYAFGEDTLLARRRTDGEARPPSRVTDKSLGGGLGARLNRARAESAPRVERP